MYGYKTDITDTGVVVASATEDKHCNVSSSFLDTTCHLNTKYADQNDQDDQAVAKAQALLRKMSGNSC